MEFANVICGLKLPSSSWQEQSFHEGRGKKELTHCPFSFFISLFLLFLFFFSLIQSTLGGEPSVSGFLQPVDIVCTQGWKSKRKTNQVINTISPPLLLNNRERCGVVCDTSYLRSDCAKRVQSKVTRGLGLSGMASPDGRGINCRFVCFERTDAATIDKGITASIDTCTH